MTRTMIHSTSAVRPPQKGPVAPQDTVPVPRAPEGPRATSPYIAASRPSRPSPPRAEASEPAVILTEFSVVSEPAIQLAEAVAAAAPPPVQIHDLKLPPVADPRLVMLSAPDSRYAALYRVLRRRLIERVGGKCIMVTSAEAGAGKTTCALNLATAFAEGGRARVLLVEANLRAPGIARRLQVQPPVCFAAQLDEVRAGQDRLWTVGTLGSPWLHLLAIAPTTAARPLGRSAFETALGQLRRVGYDFIVIDGPHILGNADAGLVEDLVDGVLVTTWGRRSKLGDVRAAIEQLTPQKLAGVALLEV